MTEPRIKPTVKLIDTNGNSLTIIQRVKDALLKAGADEEYILRYHKEAMAGDYNNLICVIISITEKNNEIWTRLISEDFKNSQTVISLLVNLCY